MSHLEQTDATAHLLETVTVRLVLHSCGVNLPSVPEHSGARHSDFKAVGAELLEALFSVAFSLLCATGSLPVLLSLSPLLLPLYCVKRCC